MATVDAQRDAASGASRHTLALLVGLVAGLAGALGGPWLLGHRDRAAREPFGFALPEGFKPLPDTPGANVRKAYVHASLGSEGLVPNVTITHVNDMSVFDEAKLDEIALGMPKFFADSGVTWTKVREAQIKRSDGALVGLLEGENAVADQRFRSLQLSFPDNTGVSLVTANFPSSEAPHWEPVFQATIDASRGVASRGVTVPVWMRVAWGIGAAFVGVLIVLTWKRRPPPVSPSSPVHEPQAG